MMPAFIRKDLLIAMIILWIGLSIYALALGWREVFPAIGAVALAIGLSIFLTHRRSFQEQQRLWDNQDEIQLRMIWRYLQMQKRGRQDRDPLTLDQLEERISESFESMVEAKREEAKLETYMYEMIYSVIGTLQWGLGAMLVDWVHGV